MSDEYGVYYRPDVAERHLRAARNALLWQLGSMGVSVGLAAGAWYLWPDQFGTWAPWIIGISLASGLISSLVSLLRLLRVRRDAGLARPGLAIGLNRDGMLVNQQWFVWPEVGAVEIRPGALGGSSTLVATGRDRATTLVPLDFTDAMPATIDTAVRVLSSGRAWVDLSRLD